MSKVSSCLLGLLAVCASACTTETIPEEPSSVADALGACEAAPPTQVVIDLEHDVDDLGCRAWNGAFLVMTWKGNMYSSYVSDSWSDCRERLDEMRQASSSHGGLRGSLVETRSSAAKPYTVHRELVLEDRWVLRTIKCSSPEPGTSSGSSGTHF